MARTSNRILWENSLAALSYIREESTSSRDKLASLSYRQIADKLGLSVQQARHLCARLEDHDLVSSVPRFAPDGGQLANGYALTARGRMILREVRRLEVV